MTLFNRSSREPDSWSAAVSKKRSVFVAAGKTSVVVDDAPSDAVDMAGCDCDWGNGEWRMGAAGGGVKKELSSSVSRKSVRTENSLPSVSGRYMNGVDWPTDMGQAGFGGAGAGAWYIVARLFVVGGVVAALSPVFERRSS